jgi:hypothetical protein
VAATSASSLSIGTVLLLILLQAKPDRAFCLATCYLFRRIRFFGSLPSPSKGNTNVLLIACSGVELCSLRILTLVRNPMGISHDLMGARVLNRASAIAVL